MPGTITFYYIFVIVDFSSILFYIIVLVDCSKVTSFQSWKLHLSGVKIWFERGQSYIWAEFSYIWAGFESLHQAHKPSNLIWPSLHPHFLHFIFDFIIICAIIILLLLTDILMLLLILLMLRTIYPWNWTSYLIKPYYCLYNRVLNESCYCLTFFLLFV